MKNNILLLPLILLVITGYSQEKYKNSSLTPQERAVDLTSRLTLQEKVSLMVDAAKPVDRLGIKTYNWWNEALHGVARNGLATVFPQPIGLAATFDPDAVFRIYTAVSDEARAKNTLAVEEGSYKRYQGLTMWTPNVNIFRDPRWGRGIETYGEDPYLTSLMGISVVKGLQGPDTSKYNKLHACAKHFAVHSGPEWNRHSFDAKDIAPRDLWETYLPAFKALVTEANVKEVMCAYNRFEGEPCCGSRRLLTQILRNDWKYDGIVVADCGAIADFYKPKAHQTHTDAPTASADAVLSGTDLDCGSSYNALVDAAEKGYISEKDIDVSVIRLLKARFELGEMDNPENVSWSKIPYSVVASASHDSLALDAARKSLVLLTNKNQFLPIKRGGITIAVMGPNANDSLMQWGNYNGIPRRTITILEGIKSMLGKNDKLIYEKGCNLVDRTLFKSAFTHCISNNEIGFTAKYWNNTDLEGEPVVETQVSSPFRFCTSGATVFAAGVNLTNFSANYTSTFTPEHSGEVIFDFFNCGTTRLLVNNVEVKTIKTNHGPRKNAYKMNVNAGEPYNIQIEFKYSMDDAQLNFDLGFREEADLKKSVENVKDADIVVFVGGISPSVEGEEMGVNLPGFKGGDRTDLELPQIQRELIQELKLAGKKIVMVNCSGSPIALGPEVESCEAILQAWYPGQSGGKAVAEALFGECNPSGKLPVTFYKSISQLPDFEDYNMKGRTYRYFTGEPLFPFGYGLSYTNFKMGKLKAKKSVYQKGTPYILTIPVTNSGKLVGDEIVQLYLKKENDTAGPIKTLRAFKRVNVAPGKTVKVSFELTDKQLEWWNPVTNKIELTPGNYQVLVGNSSRNEDLQSVSLEVR